MPEVDGGDIAQYAGWYREGGKDVTLGRRALEVAGARAERKARQEITDDEYDDIVDNKNSGKSEEHTDLKEAEALLCAYYALPSLNLRLTEKGGAQRMTGTVDNENDLMSHAEMDDYRDGWFGDAMDILDELSPASSHERDPVFAI